MDENVQLFLTALLVGFVAQMIDGSLGMAYGVTATTFLLSIGTPPAMASASVHAAEVVTSGISGLTHLKIGNVDKDLFKRLVIPGALGGFLGAYILTSVPGDTIRPFIALYLAVMGLLIIRKAFQEITENNVTTHVIPLGLAGGFFDAIGGGGWGPIVTSTLVARGHNPRFAIGSVNAAEFFVTVVQAATFFAILGTVVWPVLFGLIVGGLPAAPFAAIMCQRLPRKRLMLTVGVLIIVLSARTVYLVLVG